MAVKKQVKNKDVVLDLNYISDEIKDFKNSLNKRIIGQEEAKEEIVTALERAMYPISEIKRTPLGVFLFIGPPGVGKTEIVRGMSEFLLGKDNAFTKIDCGQYKERHQRSRLIGSPPSYVGYATVPILSDLNLYKHTKLAIKEKTMHPLIQKHGEEFAIVLLDEFEKMHPELQDVFLAAFDEGHITLDNGIDEGNSTEAKKNGIKYNKNVNFKKTIFIITSNAGSKEIVKINSGKKMTMAFTEKDSEKEQLNTKKFYENKLKEFLRPEFLSRVENVIPFRALTQEEYIQRLNMLILEYSNNLEKLYGITFGMSKKAKEELLKVSVSTEKGARVLNQQFDRIILGQISKIIGSGQLEKLKQDNFHIQVEYKKDKYEYVLKDINKRKINKEEKGLKENNFVKTNVLMNKDYNSYIDYHVEEVIPTLETLNMLYEFREELEPNYIEEIAKKETFLKEIGFTDIDLSLIKKNGIKEKFNDLNAFILNYEDIDMFSDSKHLNGYIKYIEKFIQNKFQNNISKIEKKEKTIEDTIIEIEEYLEKILEKSLLNKKEIDTIVSFFHKEYINYINNNVPELTMIKHKKENNIKTQDIVITNLEPEILNDLYEIFKSTSFENKEDIVRYIENKIKDKITIVDIVKDIVTNKNDGKDLNVNQTQKLLQLFMHANTYIEKK